MAPHLVSASLLRGEPLRVEPAVTALTGQAAGVHDSVMQITKRECSTCQTMSSRPALTPLVPNAATIEAMREARCGNLPQFATVEDLFDDLHADD